MICEQCGYDEDKDYSGGFVGIFVNGVSFSTTEGETCGLYGCPNCNTIQFTTDIHYIRRRKAEYKEKMRGMNEK